MLEFFRKYQRYFFVFITIVIVTSFSFFGTFSTFTGEGKKEDRVITRAIDGSPIMFSEVQALARFIGSDREEFAGYGVMPNLCNDGVVRYDLLQTRLADSLVRSYFDLLKGDLESRLDRVKKFKSYSHPEAPFMTADAVWSRFLPAMKQELMALKEEKEVNVGTFSHFSCLYLHQGYLTPETLKRILLVQQQQFGLRSDPSLQYGDLSLFGFHSLTDWFGKDFLMLASEFILNAAAKAEMKGYKVSLEEAKGDLLVRFREGLEKLPDVARQEITYAQHLRSLGFDETTAAETWRKVLLFRRYFQGISQAAFVDRLPFKDFAMYARETANIALYRWPQALRLKNIEDLVELQYYLTAVEPSLKNPLDLPTSYLAPEVVEKDYPELVQSSFKAKIGEVVLAEVALRAQVAEVWEWQLDEKNWSELRGVFPFLAQGCTREERFQGLEKLASNERARVDSYARLKVLDLHPEWKDQALTMAPSQEQMISISKASVSLSHIEKPWRLNGLLRRAVSGDEEAKLELLSYSDDGKALFRIEEVESVKPAHLLTFEEAKNQGILRRISDRNFSAFYSKNRSKYPAKFQLEEGSWKSLADAKEDIAKILFADLFEAIEALDSKVSWNGNLYAMYRMYATTMQGFKALKKNPEDTNYALKLKTDHLEDQFKLERTEILIQRTTQEEWMKENAFVMMPNEWSPIRVPPDGELSFFYLIDKKPCENPVLDQIAFGKELIAADAQRFLAEKLLDSILKKQAIVLPQEDVK